MRITTRKLNKKGEIGTIPTYQHRLDPFFSPRRIAIVGASEQGMYSAGVLRSLLDYGYTGEIYPVNPRRETVFGLRCYADITQTPLSPDLAIIIVPRQAVLPTIRQCLQTGVPAALVITAGFAEADEEGKSLQAKLTDLLRGQPLALIGPNCAGLADFNSRTIATRLPAPPRTGPVSFVSQSGALMMALYGLFSDRQIGIQRLLSLGNQADVDLAEALQYLANDERTQDIGAFIEGIQDGPGFRAALHQALIAGKPLVLLKSGRTESGQAAAATHTAALAGSERVFAAVCRQYGAILVGDIDELIDTLQVAVSFGNQIGNRGQIALVSQSGGLGSLSADLVDLHGLNAPPLSAALVEKLRALPHIPPFGALGNPTDVRGSSMIGPATTSTLAPFLEDPDSDVVILLLAKSAVREQDAETARAIVTAAQNSAKPLCVVWVGQRHPHDPPEWPLGHEILRQAGIPLFTQPGDCIRALANVVLYGRFREKWLAQAEAHSPTAPITGKHAKHITAGQNRSRADLQAFAYAHASELLSRYQIPLAPAQVVSSIPAAIAAAADIGYPVALKALSPEMTHKTDAGLLRLNLRTSQEFEVAGEELLAQLNGAYLEGLLVQKMLPSGVEIILGMSRDPQFGPVLACGPGGILVELLDEAVLSLPPLTPSQALELIQQTKAWPLLQGFRGSPPADIPALIEIIVRLSQLAVEQVETVHFLDLNPVIVLPAGQGAFAVDCRVFGRP